MLSPESLFEIDYTVNGYLYFWGECYSGPNAGQTYSKDGSSKQCISRDFQQCPAEKPGSKGVRQDCVGVKDSNYVYLISNVKLESKKDAVKNRIYEIHQ